MSRNKHYKVKRTKLSKPVIRQATDEEKEYFYREMKREKEKYERDSKCGGVVDDHYVRLITWR